MADFSGLASLARYYREMAIAIRAHLSLVKSVEARDELSALATQFEDVASYAECCRVQEPGSD